MKKEKHTKKKGIAKLVIILTHAIRSYFAGKDEIYGTNLTYYTLFAIVPTLALSFGIAKWFQFDRWLTKWITETLRNFLPQQEDIINDLTTFAENALSQAKGSLVAGLGFLILGWTIFKLLIHIEGSFNHIWGQTKGRPIFRKISDYLLIILTFPLVWIVTIFIQIYLVKEAEKIFPFLREILVWSPYILLWFMFALIYWFIPNTKVKFSSAFIGGVFTGTLFYLLQWAYVNIIANMTSYNAIYGSFAALPLLFIWIRLCWTLILLGAEVTHAKEVYNENGM